MHQVLDDVTKLVGSFFFRLEISFDIRFDESRKTSEVLLSQGI